MNGEKVKLELKTVGKIAGKFYIPSYQRGYKWGKNISGISSDEGLVSGS